MKRLRRLLVPLLALLCAPLASAQSLRLDEQWQAGVSSRANLTSVALVFQGTLQEAFTVGNSLFDASQVQQARLCRGCEPATLIPVADASSTYGAQTWLIAYPFGSNWKLAKLPMDAVRLVKASPRADYSLLVTDQARYTFQQGLLIEEH